MTGTRRARHAMPEEVADRLKASRALTAYRARPAYQRNDYLGWIGQAKADATRTKRIDQMIDELKRGDIYMKMAWHPARTVR